MRIIAFVAISLCVLQFPLREGWAGEPIFPTPNRPVAQIISAEYSDEKTRDLHHEAERVMDHQHALGRTRPSMQLISKPIT